MITPEAIKELVGLGAKTPSIFKTDDSEPIVVLPGNQTVASLAHMFKPTRIKRSVSLLEAGSFVEYVNRFKTDNTLIFANLHSKGAKFAAVLDYHGAAPELTPAYCDHRAEFCTIETPEWLTWTQHDGVDHEQVDFATFLEDNAKLFVEPDGASLLELVRTLHGHRNARFNQSVRLDTGAQSVAYEEDIVVQGSNSSKPGKIDLPKSVTAGLAVFQGGTHYKVPARLKTKCSERKLFLRFETISKPQIIRDACLALVEQIAKETAIVPMLGNA